MSIMDRYHEFLRQRSAAGARREVLTLRRPAPGRVAPLAGEWLASALIDFSSNDYLALSSHPALIAAATRALAEFGTGAGAARLMSGSLEVHARLEEAVARLKGQEAALLFGSGYLANVGVIPALVGRHDAIFSDRLNHASIHDGCLLSGARLLRFRHNDLNHLEELLRGSRGSFRQALIVVESIYSMDGDRCPLAQLVELKNRFDSLLMVDEAHATGLYGKHGGGVAEEDGVAPAVDIAMGTFGKALGSYGAYVAASRSMIDYLINRARSFIYSTALPPAVAAASLAAIELVRNGPGLRRELHEKVGLFKEGLLAGGLNQRLSASQIVPIMVGSSSRAAALAEGLRRQGIFVTAVRPPTVPEQTARLRFSITRHHQPEELRRTAELLLTALKETVKIQERIIP